jgi:N-acetylmuramoyl-L-alanine amidase
MRYRLLLAIVGTGALLGAGRGDAAGSRALDLTALRVGDTSLALLWRGSVALVEAAPLARLITATWRSDSFGRHDWGRGTVRAEFHEGIPFARVQGTVVPLAAAPERRGSSLWIPLQVVAEWLPRHDPTLSYDRVRGELRVVAVGAAPPAIAASTVVPAPPPVTAPTVVVAPPMVTPVERTSDAARRAPPSTPVVRAATARRVVVDAGHGGNDPGMRGRLPDGRVIWEKDITLGVSRRVAALLKEQGVTVHLTRDRDTLIALADRGRIANRERGDLFISIHVNAANPGWANASGARGFETYFLAEAKTEDARRVEQMENEVVRFETAAATEANDPLGFIISDMAQNEHLRESLELAAAIQTGLAKRHPGPSRGVKQAGFSVLVRAYMPAVLVEIGFGSNPSEAAWMASAVGQQALAASIVESTMAYLEQYERRVGGGTP